MHRNHDQYTKARAMRLYFEIEKHFALGGGALSLRQIGRMCGCTSSASAQMYTKLLEEWGLITRVPKTCRTIILAKKPNRPPVFYKDVQSQIWYKLDGDNQHTVIENVYG